MSARSPRRIQLSRRRGWRKPPGAVVVSRPSKWGNPFVIGESRTRAEAIRLFERALAGRGAVKLRFTRDDVQRELAGKDLACWCPLDERCHGDVLLAIANEDPSARKLSG